MMCIYYKREALIYDLLRRRARRFRRGRIAFWHRQGSSGTCRQISPAGVFWFHRRHLFSIRYARKRACWWFPADSGFMTIIPYAAFSISRVVIPRHPRCLMIFLYRFIYGLRRVDARRAIGQAIFPRRRHEIAYKLQQMPRPKVLILFSALPYFWYTHYMLVGTVSDALLLFDFGLVHYFSRPIARQKLLINYAPPAFLTTALQATSHRGGCL